MRNKKRPKKVMPPTKQDKLRQIEALDTFIEITNKNIAEANADIEKSNSEDYKSWKQEHLKIFYDDLDKARQRRDKLQLEVENG